MLHVTCAVHMVWTFCIHVLSICITYRSTVNDLQRRVNRDKRGLRTCLWGPRAKVSDHSQDAFDHDDWPLRGQNIPTIVIVSLVSSDQDAIRVRFCDIYRYKSHISIFSDLQNDSYQLLNFLVICQLPSVKNIFGSSKFVLT